MTYAAKDVDRAIISHRWGQVRVLDTSENPAGSRVVFETRTFGRLQAAFISPDGRWYAVASEDGRTGVARVGQPIRSQVVTSSAELFSVGFVRMGNRLIGGTANGELQVYSMNPLRPLTLMSAVDSRVRHGAYFVRDMALSPDERWLAARTMAGTVRLWEIR
jgi:WD40 repeat protein